MSSSARVFPSRWTESRGDQRLLVVGTLASGVLVAYTAATAAGAPAAVLSVVFTMTVPLVAPLAWWAFTRAPAELRLLVGFIAAAATLWFIGSLVWFYYFVDAGS
jgi:hypothetical protein